MKILKSSMHTRIAKVAYHPRAREVSERSRESVPSFFSLIARFPSPSPVDIHEPTGLFKHRFSWVQVLSTNQSDPNRGESQETDPPRCIRISSRCPGTTKGAPRALLAFTSSTTVGCTRVQAAREAA